MRQTLLLVTCCVLLVGCGSGQPAASVNTCSQLPFINETATPTSTFELLWADAQKQVAAGGLQLNAFAVYDHSAAPKTTPPESRAYSVKACGLRLVNPPEVTAAQLNALPNCLHCPYTDPTGFIRCSMRPSGYCTCYNDLTNVYLPASHPEYATWEFEIIILRAQGYDVAGM